MITIINQAVETAALLTSEIMDAHSASIQSGECFAAIPLLDALQAAQELQSRLNRIREAASATTRPGGSAALISASPR